MHAVLYSKLHITRFPPVFPPVFPSGTVGDCINFVSTGSTTLSATVTRILYMFGCTLQLGAAVIRRTRAT